MDATNPDPQQCCKVFLEKGSVADNLNSVEYMYLYIFIRIYRHYNTLNLNLLFCA
jgi:hypothetical protein